MPPGFVWAGSACEGTLGAARFDGAAGLHYTAQRVTAELILSMTLLQRDLEKVVGSR